MMVRDAVGVQRAVTVPALVPRPGLAREGEPLEDDGDDEADGEDRPAHSHQNR